MFRRLLAQLAELGNARAQARDVAALLLNRSLGVVLFDVFVIHGEEVFREAVARRGQLGQRSFELGDHARILGPAPISTRPHDNQDAVGLRRGTQVRHLDLCRPGDDYVQGRLRLLSGVFLVTRRVALFFGL